MPQIQNLKSKIPNIPKRPGVYQFLDKNGGVLYIGKAKNLRSRVRQYFNGSDDRPQIPFLMEEAADFSYTVVNNELESLYLESTLIKQYLPKYNILLRDDKNYAFIKIDYSTEIPQIGYARKIDNSPNPSLEKEGKLRGYPRSPLPFSQRSDEALLARRSFSEGGAKLDKGKVGRGSNLQSSILNHKSVFFGPYTAAYKIRDTLHLMRKVFPYCSAAKVSGKPCFYYHLHRCPGVCIGKITLDEYRLYLKKIEDFLAGNTGKISKQLQSEMRVAADKKQFEKAARLRDQLNSLKLLEERQTVILTKKVDWDIVSLSNNQGYACINLFKVREGKLRDKENFVYDFTPPNLPFERGGMGPTPLLTKEGLGEVLQKFLEQYYSETSGIPKIIYTQYQTNEQQLIKKLIKSRYGITAKIITPKKGKAKNLIKLGVVNAQEYLTKWLSDQAGNLDKINQALQRLKDVLNLPQIPKRIECYDISNIQGTNAVGSMVVFTDGLPAKSQYRKFKIRSKSTPDDFAMMREMLTRRLSRLQYSPPNIGGVSRQTGRGGISKAKNLPPPPATQGTPPVPGGEQTHWPTPDLIVIDGGKGQLRIATDLLNAKRYKLNAIPVIGVAKRIEEIFIPGKSDPLILSHDDPALQLLQRLRDEAHRFGITFHRALRSKQAVRSALDDIPGIGPKTKKLLKSKFGTVDNIRNTPLDELEQVVGKKLAKLIRMSL